MASKGLLLSVLFFITALIYLTIPTYVIVTYWVWLSEYEYPAGKPMYTFALFAVFCFIVTILLGIIFIAAGARAIVQRNNEVDGLGIPKGVTKYAIFSIVFFAIIFGLWYGLYQEIAFFSMKP